MFTGKLSTTTPSQLQDFLTCPQMYNFKHVLKIPDPLTGAGWLGMKVHETLNAFKLYRGCHQEEKSTTCLDTKFCIKSFSSSFFEFNEPSSNKIVINWKKETPQSLYLLGEKFVTIILKSYSFRNSLLQDTRNTYLMHLLRDPVQDTFIPCADPSDDTLSIECCFDGIMQNHTIIEYHTCKKSCNKAEVEAKLKFGLLGIAIHMKYSHPSDQSTSFICYNMIKKANYPILQVMTFEKNDIDRKKILKYLYDICLLIETNLFPPRATNFCKSCCSYMDRCNLFNTNEVN